MPASAHDLGIGSYGGIDIKTPNIDSHVVFDHTSYQIAYHARHTG